jgi:hypothetical protein
MIKKFLGDLQSFIEKPEFPKISVSKVISLFLVLSKTDTSSIVSSQSFSLFFPFFKLKYFETMKHLIDLFLNKPEENKIIQMLTESLLNPSIIESSISSCIKLLKYAFKKSKNSLSIFFHSNNPISSLLALINRANSDNIFDFLSSFNKHVKRIKKKDNTLFEQVKTFWRTELNETVLSSMFKFESRFYCTFVGSLLVFAEFSSKMFYSILQLKNSQITPMTDDEGLIVSELEDSHFKIHNPTNMVVESENTNSTTNESDKEELITVDESTKEYRVEIDEFLNP